MSAVKTNHRQVESKVRKSMADFRKRLSAGIREVCYEADDTIKSHTPVHTGSAVRNYLWTTGTPSSAVFEPIDNGSPGPTNSMSLGAEPRREVNEAAARETLDGLDFSNPFQTFILTNNDKDIGKLELGLLPTPATSRSPNGMFGLTQNYIGELVRSKGFAK
ncbi:neck [Citromicrobium phage vB_CbaS-RXM]|nr:neck [Citromicrobium phage vB_CbaS-RXM]